MDGPELRARRARAETPASAPTSAIAGGIRLSMRAAAGRPSDRGRSVRAARELGRHLVQAERGAEAPPELLASEERDQLGELPREPQTQGAVEAAHHGPARRAEDGCEVAHVADLVAQDLVVEEAEARGDLGLVGEQLDAAVAEQVEDDAAGHLGRAGERPVPALGRADQ